MGNNFGLWLQQQREKAKMSQSDLARSSGLSRAIINKTENANNIPLPDTLVSLARGLHISAETIFRAAGYLPEKPKVQDDIDDLVSLFSELDQSEREEFLAMLRFKVERGITQKVKTSRKNPARNALIEQ